MTPHRKLALAVIARAFSDYCSSGCTCPECRAFLCGRTAISRFWYAVAGLSPRDILRKLPYADNSPTV